MEGGGGAVMSGMRPTGRLHLGNWWGALRGWLELQETRRCWFAVADWHMLTTGYDDTEGLADNVREMVLDWLAAGLDPGRSVLFRQSRVPEHAELALLLGMVTPLSWLENCPTWKEQLQELSRTKHEAALGGEAPGGRGPGDERLRTFGFLGYPVLQAADILLYDAELVPVGQDQLAHLELCREIARRFNGLYGSPGAPVLVEPRPLLTPSPRVPGVDGRKMSKSYGNTIELLETEESLKAKVAGLYTDPTRARATDPGHPEPCPENPPGCSAYALHKLYNAAWEERGKVCRAGRIGCVACKKDLAALMEGPFGAFREARGRLSSQEGLVERVLEDGGRKASEAARRTMCRVRRAMRLAA